MFHAKHQLNIPSGFGEDFVIFAILVTAAILDIRPD